MAAGIYKTTSTGDAAISATAEVPTGRHYRLCHVSLNLSAAPTTSENYTITLNAEAGNEYDTTLYSVDLSAEATTDVFWFPDDDLYLAGGDAVDVAYANTDGNTYGVQITIAQV